MKSLDSFFYKIIITIILNLTTLHCFGSTVKYSEYHKNHVHVFCNSVNIELEIVNKIKIFLEHIRSNYFLKTETFDAGFQRALAGKSGISEAEVKVLFRKIYGAQRVQYISENDLIELTGLIDQFLHTTVG
mgnify:CR=1 FL=1